MSASVGLGCPGEQGRRRHDHPALAIAALGHVEFCPGLLDGMGAVRRQALDGDDIIQGLDGSERQDAGAYRIAINVDGTGPALADPATVFRAGQAKLFTQDPKERGRSIGGHVHGLAVDTDLRHASSQGCMRRAGYGLSQLFKPR